MRDEVPPASGSDALRHEEGHERVAEQEPRGDERAALGVEGEHGSRGNEREENDHARNTAEPAMERAPPLHHPRHEQDAHRERDERGRDMDTQGREPKRREAHRQLLDRERRELAEVEIREARRDDERCAERQRGEEEEAEAVFTNAIPHAELDAWDRGKFWGNACVRAPF